MTQSMWPFGATILKSLTKKGTCFDFTDKPGTAAEPEKSNSSEC